MSMATVLCTTNHSALQQQRLYVLETLAQEEGKGERLSYALKKLHQCLKDAECLREAGKSASVREVKRSIRGLTFKLNRSQNITGYLARNLETINSQIAILEQYQWRLTAAEYRRQSIYGVLMSRWDHTVQHPSPAAISTLTPFVSATSTVWPQTVSPCDMDENTRTDDPGHATPGPLIYRPTIPDPCSMPTEEPALLSPLSLANWTIEQGFDDTAVSASAKEAEQPLGRQSQHCFLRPTSAGIITGSPVRELEDASCTTHRPTYARRQTC